MPGLDVEKKKKKGMHAYSITLVSKDLSPSPLSVWLFTTDLSFISRSGKTGWVCGNAFLFLFFFFFFYSNIEYRAYNICSYYYVFFSKRRMNGC